MAEDDGGNKNTFPVLAIVDPNFMLSVPPKFTAYQGFDALFHSTESYINNTNNIMRDMLAPKATIESVGQNPGHRLPGRPERPGPREKVAYGSSMSGMVMKRGQPLLRSTPWSTPSPPITMRSPTGPASS
ncbi:MAG: iron-containing alcohol dehydrogenase [Evtepia sp.]